MNRPVPSSKSLIRLILVGVATATLAACASKPKPLPPAPPEAPRPPPEAPRRPEAPRPPPPQQAPLPPPASALPGSVQDFVISAGDRIYFDYDSFTVRGDAKPVLDAQASWLSRYGQVKVRIEGNADERGTVDYNFALGARRANSVKDYLVSKGVAASRIDTVSYGKSKPIDPREDDAGYAANRNGHTTITDGAR
jgi:peptidoglycan-associated lipoprotein